MRLMLEQTEELGRLRARREEHNEPVIVVVAGGLFLAAAIGIMI
jgi:hypothetical protein